MRGFFLGLLVGSLLGGGGVYLAIERPWAPEETAAAALDAGAEQEREGKRGKRAKNRRKRRNEGPADDQTTELSEAQRRLVWRGDKVALPSREVDYASGEAEARSLSSGEINQVIKSKSQPVIDCIEEARGNALLKSAVTFELLVDGSGNVARSRVRAPAYLFERGFARCAKDAVRKLRFPATGGHTIVTAPYDLY